MGSSGVWDLLRRVTPWQLRQRIKAQPWFTPLTKVLFGNAVYSRSYYADVERLEASSVRVMADWIHESLAPRRVIDVGCGPGHLMAELAACGIDVTGVDLSRAALERVKQRGLTVFEVDLTDPSVELPGQGAGYDLVISCEVAEHLDARHAREFVRKLTSAAPVAYLTAAEPKEGQGVGLYHVNEQPNGYWVALMDERAFQLDATATADARRRFAAAGVVSYLACPMVFRRATQG